MAWWDDVAPADSKTEPGDDPYHGEVEDDADPLWGVGEEGEEDE